MCAHTHTQGERESASVLHTHTRGLSPYNTNKVAKFVFLNVVILNRCKQWQEA